MNKTSGSGQIAGPTYRSQLAKAILEANEQSRRFSGVSLPMSIPFGRNYPLPTPPLYNTKPKCLGNHHLKPDIASMVITMIKAGESLRKIMRVAEVAKNTVVRYKRAYLVCGGVIAPCGCGKPADHKGWCSVRYTHSEARRKVMHRLHQSRGLLVVHSV